MTSRTLHCISTFAILTFNMARRQSKFGVGMLLGAIAGAVTGLFIAPKAGKEMRAEAIKVYKRLRNEDPKKVAMEVFGDISEESQKVVKRMYQDLSVEIADLRDKYDTIDKGKYEAVVKKVITDTREKGNIPETALKKLGAYLQKDVKKIVARPKKNVRKTVNKPVSKVKKSPPRTKIT